MQAEAEPITEINITPLVDVSLVLVIVFMITMPFLVEKAMKVSASQEKVTPVSSISQPVLVEVSQQAVQVDGKGVSMQELAPTLARLMKERNGSAVAVSAGVTVSHGRVVEVLDLAAASGAQNLDLLDPEEKGEKL